MPSAQTTRSETPTVRARRSNRAPLALVALLALSLGLRLFALDWGIPLYDPDLTPGSAYRHSYHLDEDNFLWGLALMHPSEGNFDVKIYHWGTLQFYLIYGALLVSEVVGTIPAPWEEAFLAGDVEVLPRLYVIGRLVSVLFGVTCTLVVWALARVVAGERAALFAGVGYAIAPLAVVEAHYLTNDITMSALLSAGVLVAIIAVRRRRVGLLMVAGLLFGLAISAKYSAAFGLPALAVAQWLISRSTPAPDLRRLFLLLALPWVLVGIGFVVGEPYALIMPDVVWGGLQAANRGNGIDLALGAGPPLRMLGLHALHLGGLGLTWPLALLALAGLVIMIMRAAGPRHLATQPSFDRSACIVTLAVVAGLVVSLAANRVFMLRYSQPLVPFLMVAAGVAWAVLSRPSVRLVVGVLAVAWAGVITAGQLSLMAGPHPANALLAWLGANLQPGEEVARLWPEYALTEDARYDLVRLDPWYPDLPPGVHPDYIIMDDMQLGLPSPALQTLLDREYSEVARFGARPQFLGFTWDEGSTPHDWKYSHPTFAVYKRE